MIILTFKCKGKVGIDVKIGRPGCNTPIFTLQSGLRAKKGLAMYTTWPFPVTLLRVQGQSDPSFLFRGYSCGIPYLSSAPEMSCIIYWYNRTSLMLLISPSNNNNLLLTLMAGNWYYTWVRLEYHNVMYNLNTISKQGIMTNWHKMVCHQNQGSLNI